MATRLGMTDYASADPPVAIDRVDYTRRGPDGIELRVTGRWLGGSEQSGGEPLLVVQVQGRRHRFAPARDEHPLPPGGWEARFRIPPWAQPRHEGQAALWLGTSVVPVPLPGASGDGSHPAHRLPPPPALGEARAWPPEVAPPPAEVRSWPSDTAPQPGEESAWPSDVAPPPPEADPARLAEVFDSTVDTGRTGPLADLLFKESVSALHAELEERSAEVARLQGALADTRSELEARASRQAALESAHGDLRGQLQELMAAVAAQRDDYERRLTEAEQRASEASERVAAAEAEPDRLREELHAERARVTAQLGELTAARDAALADAADLRHRLATAASGHQHHAAELSALREQLATAQVSRDAAAREVAGLRAELERLGSELAVTREHQSTQGADLGEAQRLLAEARSLSEQLRSQSSH
jgi:predicted  nucleic acid-binding Zn-ribbon protein